MKVYLKDNKLIIDDKAEFYEEMINSIGASIHIMKVNEEGNTLPVWISEQYSSIVGYSFEERQAIGIDYEKDTLYHPDDIDIVHNGIKELISGKANVYAGMFRCKDKNGNWKWILSSARALTINGDKGFLLSVVVDLSNNMPEYNFLVEKYLKEIAQLKNQLKIKELTKAEKEIIIELATGKSTKEIAELRGRSYETINNHKRNIFRKLAVSKISELVCFALENGLN